jgi:hypothetical protein
MCYCLSYMHCDLLKIAAHVQDLSHWLQAHIMQYEPHQLAAVTHVLAALRVHVSFDLLNAMLRAAEAQTADFGAQEWVYMCWGLQKLGRVGRRQGCDSSQLPDCAILSSLLLAPQMQVSV